MITSLTLITSASETVFFNTQRKPTKKFISLCSVISMGHIWFANKLTGFTRQAMK